MSAIPSPLPETAPARSPARSWWRRKQFLSAIGAVVLLLIAGWMIVQHHSDRWRAVPEELVWEMLTNSSMTAPLVRHQGSIESWLQKKSNAESTVGCFYQALIAYSKQQEDVAAHFIQRAIGGGSREAMTFLAEVRHHGSPPSASEQAQEGWDSSDLLLREAAGEGYMPAQWFVGLRYAGQYTPTGLPNDAQEAVRWFYAAGTNGLSPGRIKVIEMLAQPDLKLEAGQEQWPAILEWAQELEGQGNAAASFLIGLRQMKQAESQAHYRKAQSQLEKAAGIGSVPALHGLGQIHFTGVAGKTNLTAARAVLLQAAMKGYLPSQSMLGEWAYYGYGTTNGGAPNYEGAHDWFTAPAEAGDANAQYHCGLIALRLKEDAAVAMRYFKQAATQGHREAMLYLGALVERSARTAEDFRKARALYSVAAAAGLPRAKYALGVLIRSGLGDGTNDQAAVRLFREAAEKDYPLAQLALGDAYRLGQGVPKSLCEAMRWYRKSAENLTPTACERLAECYSNGLGPLGTNQALAQSLQAQATRLQELHQPNTIF